MAVVDDFFCPICEKEFHDIWSDEKPECCGKPLRKLFATPPITNEWGGPRTFITLREEPFSSRSELNRWAKDKGYSLGESSEKHGGARNDMYANVGKIFSGGAFKGVSKGSNPLFYTKRRYE